MPETQTEPTTAVTETQIAPTTAVTVTLPEATARRLRCLAEATGRTLEGYLAKLGGDVVQEAEDRPGDAILRHYRNRTPEQVEADRAEILRTARKARPLPPGKTLADVVQGTWPGDESEEEIHALLEELS